MNRTSQYDFNELHSSLLEDMEVPSFLVSGTSEKLLHISSDSSQGILSNEQSVCTGVDNKSFALQTTTVHPSNSIEMPEDWGTIQSEALKIVSALECIQYTPKDQSYDKSRLHNSEWNISDDFKDESSEKTIQKRHDSKENSWESEAYRLLNYLTGNRSSEGSLILDKDSHVSEERHLKILNSDNAQLLKEILGDFKNECKSATSSSKMGSVEKLNPVLNPCPNLPSTEVHNASESQKENIVRLNIKPKLTMRHPNIVENQKVTLKNGHKSSNGVKPHLAKGYLNIKKPVSQDKKPKSTIQPVQAIKSNIAKPSLPSVLKNPKSSIPSKENRPPSSSLPRPSRLRPPSTIPKLVRNFF